MKKRLISLLLILALCLGLSACGAKLTEEQMATVCGTWYLMPYRDKENNPGYFELKDDGTGSFNGSDVLTWTAKQDRENPELLIVSIKMENKDKYSLEIYTGDPNYLDAVLRKDKSESMAQYMKASTSVQNSWFADLLTSWYPTETDAPVQSVEMKADGTIIMDGQTYFWTDATDWEYNDNYVNLNYYDAQGVHGSISAEVRSNGLYSFNVYDSESGWGYSYYDHPLLKIANSGSWESFDRYTMIEDYFYISPWSETTGVGDKEYTVRFDTKTSKDELQINLLEGDTIRYVAHLFMDGEYPAATLTDQQSGQQTIYYNTNYGCDPANPDALYYKTLNLVYAHANGYSVYDLETGDYLDEELRLPYIYTKLTELGEYKQAKEFLDRFTIVPSKLTEERLYNTDRLNNVSEDWVNQYSYDKNGIMISARGEDVVEFYGLPDIYDTQYFTYDAKGNIAEVEISWYDTVEAIGTPIYDNAGKLVGMNVQEADEEYTSVFTYDAEGRVLRLDIPETNNNYPYVFDYTYDDGGKLITKVKTFGYRGQFSVTSNYIYDGDVVVEIQKEWDYYDYYTETYTFTNDEQGRPLSAVITTTDPNVTYKTQEVKYIYKDLYFFDDTGLVLEE